MKEQVEQVQQARLIDLVKKNFKDLKPFQASLKKWKQLLRNQQEILKKITTELNIDSPEEMEELQKYLQAKKITLIQQSPGENDEELQYLNTIINEYK